MHPKEKPAVDIENNHKLNYSIFCTLPAREILRATFGKMPCGLTSTITSTADFGRVDKSAVNFEHVLTQTNVSSSIAPDDLNRILYILYPDIPFGIQKEDRTMLPSITKSAHPKIDHRYFVSNESVPRKQTLGLLNLFLIEVAKLSNEDIKISTKRSVDPDGYFDVSGSIELLKIESTISLNEMRGIISILFTNSNYKFLEDIASSENS